MPQAPQQGRHKQPSVVLLPREPLLSLYDHRHRCPAPSEGQAKANQELQVREGTRAASLQTDGPAQRSSDVLGNERQQLLLRLPQPSAVLSCDPGPTCLPASRAPRQRLHGSLRQQAAGREEVPQAITGKPRQGTGGRSPTKPLVIRCGISGAPAAPDAPPRGRRRKAGPGDLPESGCASPSVCVQGCVCTSMCRGVCTARCGWGPCASGDQERERGP